MKSGLYLLFPLDFIALGSQMMNLKPCPTPYQTRMLLILASEPKIQKMKATMLRKTMTVPAMLASLVKSLSALNTR
tara:strand:+ start:593 stop:820 length:228 start_codon:yes stop_codon:yes gene_type:complete